jgi:hypothetical protein
MLRSGGLHEADFTRCWRIVRRQLNLGSEYEIPAENGYLTETFNQMWIATRTSFMKWDAITRASRNQSLPMWIASNLLLDCQIYSIAAHWFSSDGVDDVEAPLRAELPAAARDCVPAGDCKEMACRYKPKLLWSRCFREKEGVQRIAHFISKTVHQHSVWFEDNDVPADVLRAATDITWCHNNCFNEDVLRLVQQLPDDDSGPLRSHALVKRAFALNKKHR